MKGSKMCGIVGVLKASDPSTAVSDGLAVLKRLEYRGYDSAGLAALMDQDIIMVKAVGKLDNLIAKLDHIPVESSVVIGHTRWATHGMASESNAHPHKAGPVAVVHNGIIENFRELRQMLIAEGYTFKSQTDTEVIAVLIQKYRDNGESAEAAFNSALDMLTGAFAVAVIQIDCPGTLFAARYGSPLLLGFGDQATYIASDAIGLGPLASRILYLEEGDRVTLQEDNISLYDQKKQPVTRTIKYLPPGASSLAAKGNYRHFMLKEIFEQPGVVGQTLSAYIDFEARSLRHSETINTVLDGVTSVTFIGCGTAYHAGLVAGYWMEQIARISTRVDIASEFRYRQPVLDPKGITIVISQSGETADTLAALRFAKSCGQKTIAVVNVPGSSIAREADAVCRTYAGPEIAVASTKAFTCQLSVLASLTLHLATRRNILSPTDLSGYILELERLPSRIQETLTLASDCEKIANDLAKARYILFVGRGTLHAIAYEGALKLKEISYISAEGYPAGELKHGPISLIDETVPVIGLAVGKTLMSKTCANLEEIQARGGQIYLIHDGEASLDSIAGSLKVQTDGMLSSPIIAVIPAQLLSYYTAVIKGTDIDQPRNLAKSVTVE